MRHGVMPEIDETTRTVTASRPRMAVWPAIERYWKSVVLIALVCTALGAAYGLSRSPTHTATASLTVGGRINVDPTLLSGYTSATQQLAQQYSRMIDAQKITRRVARELGTSVEFAEEHISAVPVSSSGVFHVRGKGSSERRAVATANAASRALITYVTNLNRFNPDSTRLIERYTELLAKAIDQRSERTRARRALVLSRSASNRRRFADATAALELTELRLNATGAAYQASQNGRASISLVQLLKPARDASNDRLARLQISTFAGLIIGLVLAGLFATLRANRAMRRSYR